MTWLKSLGVPVGFSDHSLGTEAGMLAISMGADILEKHFTLSRKLPGKDQAMSSTPDEFSRLRKWAEQVEKMKGVPHAELTDEELRLGKIYKGKWGDNR
jgi:sialic acid synthase SpsE